MKTKKISSNPDIAFFKPFVIGAFTLFTLFVMDTKRLLPFLLIILLFSNCKDKELSNTPPEIKIVNASPDVVNIGTETQLSVVATDKNGDDLSFLWSSSFGSFPEGNNSISVKWEAPETEDIYEILINVSDGKETVEGSIEIEVIKPPQPILFTSVDSLLFDLENLSKQIIIRNSGEGKLIWETSTNKEWISISNTSGSNTTDSTETILLVDDSGLDPGEHNANLIITSNGGFKEIKLIVQISELPELFYSISEIDFGNDSDEIDFFLKNTGTGTLNWSITSSENWLNVVSANGSIQTDSVNITVKANRSTALSGSHQAELSISSNGGNANIPANIVFKDKFSLKGYVYYASTTIPVSGVTIQVNDILFTTTSDGYFELINIPQGEYTLTASKGNYDTYSQIININGDIDSLAIELTSGLFTQNVHGNVLASVDNSPILNATVVILNPDDNYSDLTTVTDFNGNYQLPAVPQGTRKLRFIHEDFDTLTVELFISNSDYLYEALLTPETKILTGELTADLTLKPLHNPYYIEGLFEIKSGVHLIIEAGTILKFNLDSKIRIWGQITAIGENNKPIIFTSSQLNPKPGDWKYLDVVSPQEIISKFKNCVFEYGNSVDINHGLLEKSIVRYMVGVDGYRDFLSLYETTMINSKIVENTGGLDIRGGNSMEYIEFSNNLITGNKKSGFQINGYCNFENNLVYDNVGAAAQGTPVMFSLGSHSGGVGGNIRNNIIFGEDDATSSNYIIAFYSVRVNIYNNIFGEASRFNLTRDRNVSNTKIFNNVFTKFIIDVVYFSGIIPEILNNCFYNNTGPNSNLTLDASNINANPMFINPNYINPMLGDWSLHPTSSLIGAGLDNDNIGLLNPNNIGPDW